LTSNRHVSISPVSKRSSPHHSYVWKRVCLAPSRLLVDHTILDQAFLSEGPRHSPLQHSDFVVPTVSAQTNKDRMPNGNTGSQSNDITTHTDDQTNLQQTSVFSLSAPISEMTTFIGQVDPGSNRDSTALDSSHLPARFVATSPSVRLPPPDTRRPQSDLDCGNLTEPLTMTELEVPAAPAPCQTKERTVRRTSKRTRTDSADDDASPVPQKVARKPEVELVTLDMKSPSKTEALTKLDMDSNDQDAAEGNESPVRHKPRATAVPPETSANKLKANSNTAPKKLVATTARRRVCDTCKRRKVSIR
jgi:hypothetical protein